MGQVIPSQNFKVQSFKSKSPGRKPKCLNSDRTLLVCPNFEGVPDQGRSGPSPQFCWDVPRTRLRSGREQHGPVECAGKGFVCGYEAHEPSLGGRGGRGGRRRRRGRGGIGRQIRAQLGQLVAGCVINRFRPPRYRKHRTFRNRANGMLGLSCHSAGNSSGKQVSCQVNPVKTS